MFKVIKGDNYILVVGCYVSFVEFYVKINKFWEVKLYCENVLYIYGKQGVGNNFNDIVSGLFDVVVVYEIMNEKDMFFVFFQWVFIIQECFLG